MNKYCVMLDSGAFSAWSLKKPINCDDYIAFIKKWESYITYYINLDVIPAQFGTIPTKAEVEESARKSWETLKYLESKGLTPLPVFHQGEDFKWLFKMIDAGYDYVCISPANDRTTEEKIVWLDSVFNDICDEEGYPKIKTHSMGATSLLILSRYPWTSADSTTWSRAGRYGDIFVPAIDSKGKFVFNRSPLIIGVCKEDRNIDRHNNHFYNLSIPEQNVINTYIKNKGFTLEELGTSGKKRDLFNIIFWKDVGENLNIKKFDRTLMQKEIKECQI